MGIQKICKAFLSVSTKVRFSGAQKGNVFIDSEQFFVRMLRAVKGENHKIRTLLSGSLHFVNNSSVWEQNSAIYLEEVS